MSAFRRGNVVASFIYAENGNSIARVDRVEPGPNGEKKAFYPYLALPEGGFAKKAGLANRSLPLYRIDEVRPAIAANETVFLVEGERKADRLREALRKSAFDDAVTTIQGGANAELRSEYVAAFGCAKRVVVLADSDSADKPGRPAARTRAQRIAVSHPACDVRVIDLFPDRNDGSDVENWFDEGRTLAELLRLVRTQRRVGDDPNLLDDICMLIRRFVVLSAESLVVCTLWLLHAYAIEAFDFTPYLNISSPVRECGKTRLLDVLEILLKNVWSTSRSTVAALVRKIARDKCTLLYDETDATFKGPDEFAQALRGILNAGYQRGKPATVCVGRDHEPKDFEVFGPKAFAGIGQSLPDTVLSRSIPIEMRRKLKSETSQKFRLRDIKPEAHALRERLAVWAATHSQGLRDRRPELPEGLSDRSEDIWEPLIAIADSFGDAWPTWARIAAVRLSAKGALADDSTKTRLLNDLRSAFSDDERLHTAILLQRLNGMEEAPWSRFHHGDKPLSANGLARLLNDFGIKSRELKIAGTNRNGYERADFADAWGRFLQASAVVESTASTSLINQGFELNLQTLPSPSGRVRETGEKARQIVKVETVEPKTADDPGSTAEARADEGTKGLLEYARLHPRLQADARPASRNVDAPNLFDWVARDKRFRIVRVVDGVLTKFRARCIVRLRAHEVVAIHRQAA
jgi:hypothetical protein